MNNKKFYTVLFVFLVATIALNSSEPKTQPSCQGSTRFVNILSCNTTKSICRFRTLEFRKGYDNEVENVDCLVYGANEELKPGGGTATYPFESGTELKNYIAEHFKGVVKCLTGDAKITPAYGELAKKEIKYIIHAVAPDARIIKDPTKQEKLLKRAYRQSLILATQKNAKSIYFPLLGAGIYKIRKKMACIWALEAIVEFFKNNDSSLEKILFVFWKDEKVEPGDEDRIAYEEFSEIINSSSEPLQQFPYILNHYRIIKTIKYDPSISNTDNDTLDDPEPKRNFSPSNFSFFTRIKSMFSYLFPRSLLQKIYISFWRKKEQRATPSETNGNNEVPFNMAPILKK